MKTQIIIIKNGQKEVDKKKKPSIIPMALFLALLDQPNYSGLTWKQYIEVTIQYNAQQIYRQVILNIQQQKELEINSSEFQNIIKRQNNQKLNINGNKISGAMDLQMIGLNNLAKVEGIKKAVNNKSKIGSTQKNESRTNTYEEKQDEKIRTKDEQNKNNVKKMEYATKSKTIGAQDDIKVRFIAVEDDKTTLMCDSLNNQEFYINKENVFDRYYGENQKELRLQRIKCNGLVLGLNLPPVQHHFHYCRSTIMYLPPVAKEHKKWYNKLGNSNKNNTGGSGKGTFIEKINLEDVDKNIEEYEEQIRYMKSEYAVIIDEEGNIYAYEGTKTNLDITDRKLDNTIITHNHPEIGAFGKDDFELLKSNNSIKELRAVDSEYDYILEPLREIDVTYNEMYIEGSQLAFETGDEIQHCVMEALKERGYIRYERRRKRKS